MFVYLNGEFIDEAEAMIPVRDRGFVLGDGVFPFWWGYRVRIGVR